MLARSERSEARMPAGSVPTNAQQFTRGWRKQAKKAERKKKRPGSWVIYTKHPLKRRRYGWWDRAYRSLDRDVAWSRMNTGSQLDRAACGTTLKLLRSALSRYANGQNPVATRGVPSHYALGTATHEEFRVAVQAQVEKMLRDGCTASISISESKVTLEISCKSEPCVSVSRARDLTTWYFKPI